MTSFSLVVLAAGMGSRFGGPKQLEPLGPRKQTILEYSLQDAYRAGCRHLILVTRTEILSEIEDRILSELPPDLKVDIALQEVDNIPDSYQHVHAGRKKPWGTGHALWVAREYIHQPFVIVYSDDWYGPDVFDDVQTPLNRQQSALIGYQLGNTLSASGAVNRGACEADRDNYLTIVDETKGIQKIHGAYISETGTHVLTDETPVSMGLMLLMPNFVDIMNTYIDNFFSACNPESEQECWLTEIMNAYMQAGNSILLHTTDKPWAGVTYREDIDWVNRVLTEHYTK